MHPSRRLLRYTTPRAGTGCQSWHVWARQSHTSAPPVRRRGCTCPPYPAAPPPVPSPTAGQQEAPQMRGFLLTSVEVGWCYYAVGQAPSVTVPEVLCRPDITRQATPPLGELTWKVPPTVELEPAATYLTV